MKGMPQSIEEEGQQIEVQHNSSAQNFNLIYNNDDEDELNRAQVESSGDDYSNLWTW